MAGAHGGEGCSSYSEWEAKRKTRGARVPICPSRAQVPSTRYIVKVPGPPSSARLVTFQIQTIAGVKEKLDF
jgi:hypothetical protein